MLPELNGKLDGYAIRVPTINVSIVDLSFIAKRDTTVEEATHSQIPTKTGAASGRLVKVSSWYDNEWGFSNRMLDTAVALANAK